MQGNLIAHTTQGDSDIALVVYDSRAVRSPLGVVERHSGFDEAVAPDAASGFLIRTAGQDDLPVTIHGGPARFEYAPA